MLLLDIFSNICNLLLKENKISTVPEFVDSFFSGIYKISFICQLCQETNIYYEPFHHITVQPNTDIFSYLAEDFHENRIEHHGVFINSGHYVSTIRQNNKWYHCDDKHITESNSLTLSNKVYLVFYAKEIDIHVGHRDRHVFGH